MTTRDPLAVLSDHLKTHADTIISLDDMSRLTGYSPFHLQRKFKAAFGVTPKQFQRKCRLDNLKSQLRQSDSVTTAMYNAGYSSSSRLYEQSTANLGMTPSQNLYNSIASRFNSGKSHRPFFASNRIAFGGLSSFG